LGALFAGAALTTARAIPGKVGTAFRPELHENKEIEHFRDSKKNGSALAKTQPTDEGTVDWSITE
jgi:hypothetical protein